MITKSSHDSIQLLVESIIINNSKPNDSSKAIPIKVISLHYDGSITIDKIKLSKRLSLRLINYLNSIELIIIKNNEDHNNILHIFFLKLCELQTNFNGLIIIDGFLSILSIIYSNFLSNKDMSKVLKLKEIFLILHKLNDLGNIQLNDSEEIWNILDKIFIPLDNKTDSSDTIYDSLLEFLQNGGDNFINLKNLMIKSNLLVN